MQGGFFGENTTVKLITWNGVEQTYHAWNYTSKYEQSLYGRRYNSCGYMGKDANGNRLFYDNQTDNYHQQNYQLLWNQRWSGWLSSNVGLHYTHGDGYYEQYKRGKALANYGLATGDETGDVIEQKKMLNNFYGAVASLNLNNHRGLEATLGTGWNRYDGDHFGQVVGVPNFEYYRNNAKKTDFNVYGKVNYEFVRGLNGFVDLQYRYVGYRMQDPTDKFGHNVDGEYVVRDKFNFFNPKVGLNYNFVGGHKVYASYAIGHREPTRNDYEDNLGAELKAERLNDLEVGYKFQSRTFSAGANVYWMHYKDQFVLTGELNAIGEPIARNVGKSYRLGVELEAAWKPVNWFKWDVNATLSRNRAKDWDVTLDDGTVASLGNTPLAFSPGFIFNNIFTFQYRGLKARIQSQYVGDQYLTNTGFKSYKTQDEDGNPASVGMMLDGHFTTNLDLSYNCAWKRFGLKDVTLGVTFYNLFSAKYDNNGWAAPKFKREGGNVVAYVDKDLYEAGFAPSAPFHVMGHLSINF